jgi:hypothetical protein
MSAELRLTIGELGFAVAAVATLGRALELVRTELGVADDDCARAVLAASAHSLAARGLAARGDGAVRLAPPLRIAAEIVAASERALRCERVAGARVESPTGVPPDAPGSGSRQEVRWGSVAFHLSPAGILAQAVEDEVVLRLAAEPGISGLIDRVSAFFELPAADAEPGRNARIDRAAMRELGRLHESADIASELARRGVPWSIGARFADDLASARWKGAITVTSGRPGEAPASELVGALVAGAKTWFLDTRSPDFALLGVASRPRLDEAVRAALRAVESTTPSLDRAAALDA